VRAGIFSENARHFEVKFFSTRETGGNNSRSKIGSPPFPNVIYLLNIILSSDILL
jgi:hypothetical protein